MALDGLQVGKTYRILPHVLIELDLAVTKEIIALNEFVDLLPLHMMDLSLQLSAAQFYGLKIGREATLLRFFRLICRNICLMPSAEICGVVGKNLILQRRVHYNPCLAVTATDQNGAAATTSLDIGIVLRLPIDQIGAFGIGELGVILSG